MPRHARSMCLVALAGLAAFPAAARCPEGPADATTGIDILYTDGTSTRLKIDPDGLSRSEVSYNDGTGLGELVVGHHGYLVSQLWGTQDGVLMTGAVMLRDFPPGALTALPLDVGETQELAVTSRYTDANFDDRLLLAAGPDTTTSIGSCTLRTRQVTVTLATMEVPEVETYLFLPDIGIAVHLAITGGDAPPLTLVPERIAVVE